MTTGYKKDINQVRLNNIFKINEIPKNITKNKIIETNNWINVHPPLILNFLYLQTSLIIAY